MEKKAIALADSTIKPVSGNEEPGVVARQSSNSSCVLPIKKRYSMLYTRAPIHPDPSFSNENESKTKDCCDNYPNTSSVPSRNVDDVVKPALAEKLAGKEAIGTTKVSVVVGKQGESHSKVELPADSGHVELSLGPKKPHVSSLSLHKNDVDDSAFINRCNWDLNTSIDSWIQDATQIDLNSSLDTKPPPISSASVIASNADKGKQLVGASPTLQHKSADVLRLSPGSTLRGFDSSVLQSLDSRRVSPNSSLLENVALNRKMNSPTVKSEAVVQANAGTAVRPGGTFKANVVKTEVARQNIMQSSELLEQKPVKCEPIQEEISDVIAPRVLQRQESSSSSSSTRLSTPFDHTNEANRSKNAQDQANAAKNANFDLKEVNVTSDKVEAASTNIEDHTVYKKTHNLVASGEGSAKKSISAGTEEECYESDAHHVDTVREDEEYEDGEIREPMIAEGMDSGENKKETTGDDEQRPMGAIYNVTFSSNFLPVSSTSGKKIYYFLEEDKFHRRRNRFQDRSFGSSRGNFMRGRGRGRGRGRNFVSHGDVADYRFRHQRTTPWLNGAAFASNRRRKPLNDALPSFGHPAARRLSPNGREDASMMAPRNITAEDSSAFVGLRHREKFNRDFPADPVYSHQQSNTKFTTRQRSRGFPRMRSKSPVTSGTWFSPRRRLTEGFNDHRDSSQHRSPFMNREDRMKSSPLTSEAIAPPQRRDFPSYTPYRLNHTRDVDAVQEHAHPRSLSNRRSPPDRVFTGTDRRVENLDHQERAEGDGRPIHTGRFPELQSCESTDERRNYGEGQGGPRQMRNVEDQEDEFDVSKLKKRRI